ncbi:SEC-C domain-containing protein [bacterium]|nr:SEC-C domain-containing protein [bacterium]
MNKIGRNQPCPCGSGRKYKLCCLSLHDRARAALAVPLPFDRFDEHYEHLDALIDTVLDRLDERRYEEAEKTALQLMEEHPEDPEGLERLAQVYDAWGKKEQAARVFRQAAAFQEVLIPINRQTAAWLREQADRMDQGLDMVWPDGDLDGPDVDDW